MKWFEPILIIIFLSMVIIPLIAHIKNTIKGNACDSCTSCSKCGKCKRIKEALEENKTLNK